MYSQSRFLAKTRKNIKTFHLKIIIFSTFRNCCILHGHVFVMVAKMALKIEQRGFTIDQFHQKMQIEMQIV